MSPLNYDGTKLAANGIVVVTISYRLGVCWPLGTRTMKSRISSSSPCAPSTRIGRNLMRKLNLRTRAELVLYALANGLIGPT